MNLGTQKVKKNIIPGPNLYVSGPFLQHKPYPNTELYRWGINGVEDAKRKVRKLFNAGVDFTGKTVTIVVPFKEGGGTSRFTRFMQPFLTKYVPGKPIIKIMHIPGGGAIKGSNYFQKNPHVIKKKFLLTESIKQSS